MGFVAECLHTLCQTKDVGSTSVCGSDRVSDGLQLSTHTSKRVLFVQVQESERWYSSFIALRWCYP